VRARRARISGPRACAVVTVVTVGQETGTAALSSRRQIRSPLGWMTARSSTRALAAAAYSCQNSRVGLHRGRLDGKVLICLLKVPGSRWWVGWRVIFYTQRGIMGDFLVVLV
jgi:hypothetical protein